MALIDTNPPKYRLILHLDVDADLWSIRLRSLDFDTCS